MGHASNYAQWKKLSGLTDKRWTALSRKQRAAFIHDAAVARGVLGGHASNEAQGQALSKLDDEVWALLAQRERDAFITAAASERGDAINEAQGQVLSKLDDAEWALLAQTQRDAFKYASVRGVLSGDASVEAHGRRAGREAGVLNWHAL